MSIEIIFFPARTGNFQTGIIRLFHIKAEGLENGVYIRLGSTNRRAGSEMIAELQRLARNSFFDEKPFPEINSEDIDFRAASEFFSAVARKLTSPRMKSLGLVVYHGGNSSRTF